MKEQAPAVYFAAKRRSDESILAAKLDNAISDAGWIVETEITDDATVRAIAVKGDERRSVEGYDNVDALTKLADALGVSID